MTQLRWQRIHGTLMLLAVFLGTGLLQAQVSINSRFEPALVHADDPAQYVLQVSGGHGGLSGKFPETAGLQVIGPQQTSQSTSVINGVVSRQYSISIPMSAQEPGTYTVPSFSVEISGEQLTVPAAQLQVLPVDQAAKAAAEAAFPIRLQMNLPQGPYYVGQAIPVTLALSYDPQVSISGSSMPAKTGSDNYMLSPIAEVTSRRAEVGGKIMNQHLMGAIVTPLSVGDVDLGFEQTVVAYIPPALRGGARTGRPQNDPFAQMFGRDSMFDRMTNREEVKLKTDAQELKVEPLPTAGRPAGFTGAIGEFSVSQQVLSEAEITVGEPVTLSFSIEGTGNFDRIQPPTIKDSADWRSYSPQVQFQPGDPVGYGGRKRFEYTLIARHAGVETTPPLSFSYFNPETAEYTEIELEMLPLAVLPSPDAPAGLPVAPVPAARASAAATGELLPLMPDLSTARGQPELLIAKPVFYAVQVLPAAALLALVVYRRRKLRLLSDPYFARSWQARRQARKLLADATGAAQQNDAAGFYRAAGMAISEVISRHEPDVAASSLTWEDLARRLQASGTDAATTAQAKVFFTEADALRYGNPAAASGVVSLGQRQRELEALLRQLQQAPSAAVNPPAGSPAAKHAAAPRKQR